MLIGRRTFIQSTALVATTSLLPNFPSPSSAAQSHASPQSSPLPPQLTADRACMNGVAFRIHGWDSRDDVPINSSATASADPVPNYPAGDQVLICINQSWRTAWR
jgi:hypothetical protein